jgi:adenine-specific DNA-methyltransferase
MAQKKRPIEQYQHEGQERLNNPPAGLGRLDTAPAPRPQTYAYDPHLDPQLVWAGKAEHTSFAVPTVSLHVHERIDPRTIIQAVRANGDHAAGAEKAAAYVQGSFFDQPTEVQPLREAVEFYRHAHGWSNRLVAGDSLLVMNSLLQKEGLAGKVQMVYLDPPYGIKYGSNFQPFVNKRDVKDGKDEDLTAEPEQIRAFRDTWELGLHSYLTYMRDRLLLARELLAESGSVFVQISDENVHHVREVMDEVFGVENYVSTIYFATTGGFATTALSRVGDYILWYSRDGNHLKYRQLHVEKGLREGGGWAHSRVEYEDGSRKNIGVDEVRRLLSEGQKIRPYSLDGLSSQGLSMASSDPFEFEGRAYHLPPNSHWKTNSDGMRRLVAARRIEASTNSIRYVRFLDDFPVQPITNIWDDTNRPGYIDAKTFVVQTSAKVVERCLLMATDPGDLVLDPTCGSGTTATVAEQWGRRWITCDTSRVALALARQRLMTAVYDYYELAHPTEGVSSGFTYKTVPHVTLKSIANSEPPGIETLYDQPLVDRSKTRVSGPFTVEAVPAPTVISVESLMAEVERPQAEPLPADASVARSGETLRLHEWRAEMLRTGVRGKGGQRLSFARLEPMPGCRWLHAEGETRPAEGSAALRVVVSFGPEHAPLTTYQVAGALEEAQNLMPHPALVLFCAFQFDPEAAKEIDQTRWPGVTLLRACANADLLTDDLKKKRATNETFWLMGQPDVQVAQTEDGRVQVSVHGFDYYNTRTGELESGGADRIAVWMLDTDYDGRSLFPRQVFFPMEDAKGGWARLARSLRAEVDDELIEAYRGTVSLPFKAGAQRRAAVKIVDDRGIESLQVVELG